MFLPSTSKLFCSLFAILAVFCFQPYLVGRIVAMQQWHFMIWWVACWLFPIVMSWMAWKAGESRSASVAVLLSSIGGSCLYGFSLLSSPASQLYTGWDVLGIVLMSVPINIMALIISIASIVASASALARKDYLIYPPAGYFPQQGMQSAGGCPAQQYPYAQTGYAPAPMPAQYSVLPANATVSPRKGFVATFWKPFVIAVLVAIVAPLAITASCQASNGIRNAIDAQASEDSWKKAHPREASYIETRGLEPYLHFYYGNDSPYLYSEYKDGIGAVSWAFDFDSSGKMHAYSGDFSGLKFQEKGCSKWNGKAFAGQVVFDLKSFDDRILAGLDREDMEDLSQMEPGHYGDAELAPYLS